MQQQWAEVAGFKKINRFSVQNASKVRFICEKRVFSLRIIYDPPNIRTLLNI